ncbi:type IV pili methyl-accepting chemotaxis transducer N-terminal domain-containing protein [Neisseriaceae bacterium CLB008]
MTFFAKLPISKNLSTKLVILTLVWWVLALLAIGFTLSLSWRLEGAGAAINDAGSLRMRAYRMALMTQKHESEPLLQQEMKHFERVLSGIIDGDASRPLALPKRPDIQQQADRVRQQWQHQYQPKIKAQWQSQEPVASVWADDFVFTIDQLVRLLEDDNTQTINQLRLFQKFLIGLVVAGSLFMMYVLFSWIVKPLGRLKEGMAHVANGDFNHRVALDRNDEFGLISIGFNQMAANLEDAYSNLADKVHEKTADLEERNHELKVLYDTTTYIHQDHPLAEMCEGFLQRVIAVVGASAGSVKLIDEQRQKMDWVAAVDLPEHMLMADVCTRFDACHCGEFAQQKSVDSMIRIFDQNDSTGAKSGQESPCQHEAFGQMVAFPISYGHQKIGLFNIHFYAGHDLSESENHLLHTLGNQLGVAIGSMRLVAQLRKMAVLEERNMMAQGLHDSIAQSLTFLNLQVQMLDQAWADNKPDQVRENLDFIRDGVQECYENVRELLLNFRMPIKNAEFTEAVAEVIKRFEMQVGISVDWQASGQGMALDPKQQIQVIFILQEGLSNIRKHAQAHKVTVRVHNDADFVLTLSDDGQGFDEAELADKTLAHVGMAIMQERAERIQAQLSIHSVAGSGTTLTLTIPHQARKAL